MKREVSTKNEAKSIGTITERYRTHFFSRKKILTGYEVTTKTGVEFVSIQEPNAEEKASSIAMRAMSHSE